MRKLIVIWIIFLFSILNLNANEKYIQEEFFGLHMHRLLKKDKPWALIPFKTWRLWDTGICWAEIQPEKDVWKFELIDKAVKNAEENNVDLVINIGLSPKWAAKRSLDKAAYGIPYITTSEPKNIDTWKEYVRTLANRYKGKIKYWEIWNEPDMLMFYSGSVEDMVLLVKEAYLILKEVDSENKIISPSVTGYLTLIPWLNRFFEAGGKDYIDIIGTHFYVWSASDKPEKAILTIERIQYYEKIQGMKKLPIWNTECGFRKKIINDKEQSMGYIARLCIIQWYYGIDRVMFYSYDNNYIINMLIKTNDYSGINHNGIAFKEIQKWLIGSKILKLDKKNDDIWIANIIKENGEKGMIIWHSKNDIKKKIKYNIDKNTDYKFIYFLNGDSKEITPEKPIEIGICPVLLTNDMFFFEKNKKK